MQLLRYKKELFLSFVISIALLFAGYFGNNMSIFTGESLESLAIMETVNRFCGFQDKNSSDSVIYINTAFDKDLIECYEKEDFEGSIPVPLGNTEITDRNKLIDLLKLLKEVSYKYLIIDIRFAKGLESDTCYTDSITGEKVKTDDKLFSIIKQLDRVVVATHHNIRLINEDLEKKAALADYMATATATNFVRYEYFDSIPYIPMAVYNDLRKRNNLDTILCHYPFGKKWLKPFALYTQGNRLCYNSLFLDFNIRGTVSAVNESGQPIISELDYLNLSKDILEVNNPSSIVKNFKNKYIFIGNLTEDIHDTYAGPQPGCVILYKALKALENQRHVISFIEIVILLSLYFGISMFILCGKNIFDLLKKSDNALVNFIVDTTTFTLVLGIYHIIEYNLGRTSFCFVVPILVFTILKTYIILEKRYKMKSRLLMFLLALISGFLMSFTPDDNERSFRVHSFNSDRILIDGQKPKPGMMISLSSKISFKHPKEWVKLLNQGKNIKYQCGTHDKKEIWENGDYRKIQMGSESHSANLFWWITWHKTSTKGNDDAILLWPGDSLQINIKIDTTFTYKLHIDGTYDYKELTFSDSSLYIKPEAFDTLSGNVKYDIVRIKGYDIETVKNGEVELIK